MPRGDGSGPMGGVAMTGRAAGFCVGYGEPGFANPAPWGGRCFRGMGRGGGGWRGQFPRPAWTGGMALTNPAAAAPSGANPPADATLALREELTGLKQRLAELEAQAGAR